MKIEFTEEEIRERKPETLKKLADFIRMVIKEETKNKSDQSEVKICVTENLSMGEKIG